MNPVQKTDLNTLFPMPVQQITITLDRVFSADEADLLKLGFAPREMQDKWFIYFENDALYFHRSWTGYCVYQVFFAPEVGGALRMIRAVISRDPEQYKETSAERDAWMISHVIDSFLLRRD